MRKLTIDGKEFSIAENFNELSKDQLLNFIENFYIVSPRFYMVNDANEVEPISFDATNALLYAQLINVLKIDLETFDKLTPEDVVFLIDEMKCIDFLLDDSNLTINHFPTLNENLVGTENDFASLTAEEFLWAERFYLEYKTTKEIAKLDAMIACLYKSKNKKNQLLPFEVKRISVLEKYIAKVELNQKIAILLFFEGCRNEFPICYPYVYAGKKSDDAGEFKEVLLQVAKDGPFGHFDNVLKTNIHLLFSELNRVAKEAIEFERKNKK